jgi:hypothetical protein
MSVAFIDGERHPDPRRALEEELGPLLDFEITEAAEDAPGEAASTPAAIYREHKVRDCSGATPPVRCATVSRWVGRPVRVFALHEPPLLDPAPPPLVPSKPVLILPEPEREHDATPSYDETFIEGDLDPFIEADRVEAARRWLQSRAEPGEEPRRAVLF